MIPKKSTDYLIDIIQNRPEALDELNSFLMHISTIFLQDYRTALFSALPYAETNDVLQCLLEKLKTARTFINDPMLETIQACINRDNPVGLGALLNMPFYQEQHAALTPELFRTAILQRKFLSATLLLSQYDDTDQAFLLNQVSEDGTPLLQQCFHANNMEGINFLVAHGCNINQEDARGQRLVTRLNANHAALLSDLAEYDVDIEPLLAEDPGYLFYPQVYNYPHTLAHVLAAGADLLQQNRNGATIIQVLAQHNLAALETVLRYTKELVIKRERLKTPGARELLDFNDRQLEQLDFGHELLAHCRQVFSAPNVQDNVTTLFTMLNLHWLSEPPVIAPDVDQDFFKAIRSFLRHHYPEQYGVNITNSVPSLPTLCLRALDLHYAYGSNPHTLPSTRERMQALQTYVTTHSLYPEIFLRPALLMLHDLHYFNQVKETQLELDRRQRIYTQQQPLIEDLLRQLNDDILTPLNTRRANFARQAGNMDNLGGTLKWMGIAAAVIAVIFFIAEIPFGNEENGSPYSNAEVAGLMFVCGLGAIILVACLAICGCLRPLDNYLNRVYTPRLEHLTPIQRDQIQHAITQLQTLGFFNNNRTDVAEMTLRDLAEHFNDVVHRLRNDLRALNPDNRDRDDQYLPTPDRVYTELSLLPPILDDNRDIEMQVIIALAAPAERFGFSTTRLLSHSY